MRVEEAATEVGGRLVFGPTKTYEARTVIVPRFVITRVAPLLQGKGSDDLVFTAPGGGPLRHSNFIRRVWRRAVEASGAPEDLVVHDLRDTAASLDISAGASVKAVQRMLGHASAAMTLDTYGSLLEEDLEGLLHLAVAAADLELTDDELGFAEGGTLTLFTFTLLFCPLQQTEPEG